MRTLLFVGCVLAVSSLALAAPQSTGDDAVSRAVRAVIGDQQAAWNRGDLEGFLQGYWQSPHLTFSSGGTTRRGYNDTRARFLETYPTRDQMGRLAFDDLEVTPLGDAAALMLGRWTVQLPTGETFGGNFTIVLRKIDDQWRIVHDHTSRLATEEFAEEAENPPGADGIRGDEQK